MRQLLLDAGPLISLFYAKDTHHAECVSGFKQLASSKTTLLTPIPIIFEVYKWLLQRIGSKLAQSTLNVMQASLQTVPLSQIDFQELQVLIRELPGWNGSLEDATIILTAQRYCCPIWTLNYRDLGSFKGLEFWHPSDR